MEEGSRSRSRVMCTILSVDHTDMFYRVCTVCERTLPNPSSTCHSSNPPSKRLFRILVSCSISVPFLFSPTKYNIKTFFGFVSFVDVSCHRHRGFHCRLLRQSCKTPLWLLRG
ncbi:hypothetical protein V8G54_025623 [Vigna mungo]|uniref:Uncharacterized protein n=1 Tax=Vigna mungo TaxID=3915 RepID=A0AAQ3RP35_VIGMU